MTNLTTLRIFPFVHCNYKCEYCTVYYGLDKLPKYDILSADKWIKAIERLKPYFADEFQIVLTGGEPTLYRDFVELCEGLKYFNVVVYSNISEFAYEKFMQLKNQIKIYPSYHNKAEGGDFKTWLNRLLDIKAQGHHVYMTHCVNDGSEGIENVPPWVMKPNIEGYWEGKYHSPYINECRIDGKELRHVRCSTWQFVVGPDGDMFNCQTGLWRKDTYFKIGNIVDMDWENFPGYFDCKRCGNCHICSAGKIIGGANGEQIKDKWQYIPAMHPDDVGFVKRYTTEIERGSLNE